MTFIIIVILITIVNNSIDESDKKLFEFLLLHVGHLTHLKITKYDMLLKLSKTI